jgi:hypothetical protein
MDLSVWEMSTLIQIPPVVFVCTQITDGGFTKAISLFENLI